ncbi:MAG TPA: amidase [Burkholderiales bacterium]|nr:amidase [Burkholderiales bacterium]
MDDAWLGIAEAARLFRSRERSPLELTQCLLARIDRLDARCNAFLHVARESALAEAKAAGAELAAGRDRGPLHGIPYAVKDIIDVAGLRTTCHSKILRDNIASADAPVIAQLREAGAVLLGKLALHEFATGGPTTELPWPPARNPWNLELHPGGSSSGSGTALAAGLVPAALGTDTGGSVRNPATVCGGVGMKPTHGLVSCEGVFPLAPSLDVVGPMTRSVEDNALLLEAMTGRPRAYASGLRAGLEGLRLGLLEHFHTEDDSAHPEQVAALARACETLRELGARVEPVHLPPLAEWRACGLTLQRFEQYEIHREWLKTRPQDYAEVTRSKLLPGASISAQQAQDAHAKRRALREALAQALKDHAALIALSGFEMPRRFEDPPAEILKAYMKNARMPFNVSGTPALAVPTGFSSDGLPLGMQIAGKAHDEALLYRIAWAYEQATGWTRLHPAAFASG